MPDYGAPPPPHDTITLGGGWDDPEEPKRRRTWWYVGGGTVAALALIVGGTVYAASQVNHDRDPGPAAGLPSDTLAYAAVDLDPSAGQKIEAIKALRRFPAFTDGFKLDPSSDLRKLMLQDELTSEGCGLDWDKDVAPWLGNDVGAAVVPTSGQGPQPVAILAVSDEAAARKDLPKLLDCGTVPHGISVADGWAVVAATDSIADGVTAAARGGSLADDADFKTWTGRTGDEGVATFYASPDAGSTLAGSLDTLVGRLGSAGGTTMSSPSTSVGGGFAPAAYAADDPADPADPFTGFLDVCPKAFDSLPSGSAGGGSPLDDPSFRAQLDAEKAQLAKLRGAAATLRFAHSGFELETASGVAGAKKPSSDASGLTTLPGDTAIAFAVPGAGDSLDQAASDFADGFVSQCGGTPERLWDTVSRLTGLTLPADLTTLLGGGLTFGLSGDIDPEKVTNGGPAALPVGVKLRGDADKIADALGRIKLPGAQQILGTSKGDGVVAVGPDADYRAELLKKGSLGDSDAFTDVVPHADQAASAFYVSFDSLKPLIDSDAAGFTADDRANLAHLQSFGASSWTGDDGVTHGLVRLSTK